MINLLSLYGVCLENCINCFAVFGKMLYICSIEYFHTFINIKLLHYEEEFTDVGSCYYDCSGS